MQPIHRDEHGNEIRPNNWKLLVQFIVPGIFFFVLACIATILSLQPGNGGVGAVGAFSALAGIICLMKIISYAQKGGFPVQNTHRGDSESKSHK